MRFTVRDLLWLTIVVALTCVLVGVMNDLYEARLRLPTPVRVENFDE